MELSKETMAILNGFSAINPSILIESGSVIRTIDSTKTIIGSAEVKEVFERQIPIYDVPNFLQVIKMFDGAKVEFGEPEDKFCLIKFPEADEVAMIMYAHPDAIDTIKKDVVMPPTEINFKLSEKNFNSIVKAATTMGLNHLIVTPGDNGTVLLTVTDIDNSSSHNFKISIPANLEIDNFSVVFDMGKISILMPMEYDVGISTREISHFFGKSTQYWVSINTHSQFG